MVASGPRSRPTPTRLAGRYPDTAIVWLLALIPFGISLMLAALMPPFWGVDERAHAGYVIELANGNLPRIDTEIPDDPSRFPDLSTAIAGWEGIGRQIWVANHPPVYYLLSLPFVAVADWLGVPTAGLFAMRVINALGVALTVVVVWWIARELVPGRRTVPLLAAALMASAVTFSRDGAYAYNDGVAGLASALCLLVGIRMLRHGLRRDLLVCATLATTLAAGTKAPALVAVAACTLMAALAAFVHPAVTQPGSTGTGTSDPATTATTGPGTLDPVSTGEGSRPARRWWRAAGAAAVVGGVPALGFGWFYLRNLYLYGDLTAAGVLLEAFQRAPRGDLLGFLLDLRLHRRVFEAMWAHWGYSPQLLPFFDVMVVAALVGWLLLAGAWFSRWRRVSPRRDLKPRQVVLGWLVMVGHAVLTMVLLLNFYSAGGNISIRYLLPLTPLVMTALALGLVRLAELVPARIPARRDAVTVLAITIAMFVLGVVALRPFIQAVPEARLIPGLQDPLLDWPAPAAGAVLAIAAAAGVVALQVHAAWRASRTGEPTAGEHATESPAR